MQNVFLGTELKLNINIEPIGDLHMSDYDFIVEAYCNPNKSITIEKKDAIQGDNGANKDNYIVLIDTNSIGPGNLKCKITAEIRDEDFKDYFRTEVAVINTDIQIVKA